MDALITKEIQTRFGRKEISVVHTDVCDIDEHIDILTLSAFRSGYAPTRGTVIGALKKKLNIDVSLLAQKPLIDLRNMGSVWLSEPFLSDSSFGRIGCVEMTDFSQERSECITSGQGLLNSVGVYFRMLEIAAMQGVAVGSVAISALGTNRQRVALDFILAPLLNECIGFLERCEQAERIIIYEYSAGKAYQIASYLDKSYRLTRHDEAEMETPMSSADADAPEQPRGKWQLDMQPEHDRQPMVFISYSSADFEKMLRLNNELEQQGIRTWYAPRDIWQSSYAQSIVQAIRHADYVIALISANSLNSRHVINEIDLAFNALISENRLLPIRLDDAVLTESFEYYLSRLEWYRTRENQHDERLPLFEDHIRLLGGKKEDDT